MTARIHASEAVRCLQQLCVAGELVRLDVAEIARAEDFGVEQVRAILDALAAAGLVEYAHDCGRLIRPPASISLSEVWAALDPSGSRRPRRAFPGTPGATTLADVIAWEAQLFESGPTAHAA